jgi:hypothetical protein
VTNIKFAFLNCANAPEIQAVKIAVYVVIRADLNTLSGQIAEFFSTKFSITSSSYWALQAPEIERDFCHAMGKKSQ